MAQAMVANILYIQVSQAGLFLFFLLLKNHKRREILEDTFWLGWFLHLYRWLLEDIIVDDQLIKTGWLIRIILYNR